MLQLINKFTEDQGMLKVALSQVHATDLVLVHPSGDVRKNFGILMFSRGYKKKPVEWNGLLCTDY